MNWKQFLAAVIGAVAMLVPLAVQPAYAVAPKSMVPASMSMPTNVMLTYQSTVQVTSNEALPAMFPVMSSTCYRATGTLTAKHSLFGYVLWRYKVALTWCSNGRRRIVSDSWPHANFSVTTMGAAMGWQEIGRRIHSIDVLSRRVRDAYFHTRVAQCAPYKISCFDIRQPTFELLFWAGGKTSWVQKSF